MENTEWRIFFHCIILHGIQFLGNRITKKNFFFSARTLMKWWHTFDKYQSFPNAFILDHRFDFVSCEWKINIHFRYFGNLCSRSKNFDSVRRSSEDFDVDFSLFSIDREFQLNNEIVDISANETSIVYVVQIKSGLSSLNETADVILTLIGEENSNDWTLLNCESDSKPFRTGQLDTFYLIGKHLTKVRSTFLTRIDHHQWFD